MSLEPIFMPTEGQNRPRITVHPAREEPAGPQPRKDFQKATLGDGKALKADDFIDLINPLQHIPVVGHIYRALTGDTISKEASIVGGTLFGGPLGMAAASVNAMVEHEAASSGHAVKTAQAGAQPVQLAQMTQRNIITPTISPPPPQKTAYDLLGDEPEPVATNRYAPSLPEAPDAAQPALQPEERQKHDMILELFGSGLSSLQAHYRKSQQLAYAQQVARDMTA